MSRRKSIVHALTEKIKTISVANGFQTDLEQCAYPFLKFWDEVDEFPCVYVTPGPEAREYHPGEFKWGYLSISIKVYTRGEDTCQETLENLLEDLEKLIDDNRDLVYDANGNKLTEILITSIVTDEGLLNPFGVGEILLRVQYQVL